MPAGNHGKCIQHVGLDSCFEDSCKVCRPSLASSFSKVLSVYLLKHGMSCLKGSVREITYNACGHCKFCKDLTMLHVPWILFFFWQIPLSISAVRYVRKIAPVGLSCRNWIFSLFCTNFGSNNKNPMGFKFFDPVFPCFWLLKDYIYAHLC